jgi:hypothetical protein
LCEATADLSFLLGRGYSEVSALKLVGDRFQLTARQRHAVLRAAGGDEACRARKLRRMSPRELAGAALGVDAFNVLITLEACLGGGVVFVGRDGALRDIASVHGTYRHVEETEPALALLERTLTALSVARLRFYLDRPVGNSGRLRGLIEARFAHAPFACEALLCDDVDRRLVAEESCVASSDSWILDHARAWFDLPSAVIETQSLPVHRLDFGASTP